MVLDQGVVAKVRCNMSPLHFNEDLTCVRVRGRV